jgi:hypothetical protein
LLLHILFIDLSPDCHYIIHFEVNFIAFSFVNCVPVHLTLDFSLDFVYVLSLSKLLQRPNYYPIETKITKYVIDINEKYTKCTNKKKL